MLPWSDGMASEMVKWQRRSIILAAFGLVGFGALVGAGSVYLYYIKQKIGDRFQSSVIQEIQSDVTELRTSLSLLNESLGVVGSRAKFERQKTDEDDEYVTADEDEEDTVSKDGGDGQFQFFVRIDELLEGNSSQQHEAYTTLKVYKDKLGRSCDFWWRLAKATHFEAATADSNGDKKLKKEHFENAFSCAEKGLALNDKSAEAHKWYAITIGSCSEFAGVNEKIKSGYKFKEHVDRAVSLNPNDPTCYHLLGRFCFEVSQLSWIERRVAATLFSAPPTSTPQEAITYFKKAENLKPFMDNRFYMAKCYQALGDTKHALKWLEAAAAMPAESSTDKATRELVLKLRAKLK